MPEHYMQVKRDETMEEAGFQIKINCNWNYQVKLDCLLNNK